MKYTTVKKGYGKYTHEIPKNISDKKAENMKSKGERVFDSYDEAKEHCEGK